MQHHIIDGVNVYRLPKNKLLAKLWLLRKKYDLFLSIELTSSSHKILKLDNKKTPLLLWIQDPRPWYEWREINTVKLYPESCYWDSKVYEYVHELYLLGKVEFIIAAFFGNLHDLLNNLDIILVCQFISVIPFLIRQNRMHE